MQYCENDPGTAVSYFYFDFGDPNKQLPQHLVQSLIFQLSEQCEKIPEMMLSCRGRGSRYQTFRSFLNLLQLLQQIIEGFSQTYIILDALDECISREELLDVLNSMVGWKCEKLHILVTSRNNTDIENFLEYLAEKKNIVRLQCPSVDKDIHTYIRQRLSKDKNLCRWQKDQDIGQVIEDKLTEGARGMCESFLFRTLDPAITLNTGFGGLHAS